MTISLENRHAYRRPCLAAGTALFVLASGSANAAEFADGAIEASLEYSADYVQALSGAPNGEGTVLDNLELSAAFDMERLTGWRGGSAYVHVLNNSGGVPNDKIGTLQGVDNIEVSHQSLRLYELWVEQAFGAASLRAGLYDLNSEFYATDAAGLLIAPAFGIGSEIAATGANGPSIFPSTAIAVRGRLALSDRSSVKLAVLNADAGVLGDPDGIDTDFENGALVIGEWTWAGETTFALGAWGYTDDQDDIRDLDINGDPLRRSAQGAYLTLERGLWGDETSTRAATGFVRAGVSDGDTTAYRGGWQAGVLVERVFASRPDSAFSIGVNQGVVSDKFKANAADGGVVLEDAESALELTYADTVGWLTIQPDLQFIHDPAAEGARDDVIVGALRLSVGF